MVVCILKTLAPVVIIIGILILKVCYLQPLVIYQPTLMFFIINKNYLIKGTKV